MSDPRPEAIIEPTPCVWMGDYEDMPEGEWSVGSAFFWDVFFNIDPKFDRSVRKPIVVMCPTNFGTKWPMHATPFWIDSLSTEKKEPWAVTVDMDSLVIGQKPIITVSPSIHLIGIWHGWLQDGVLHQ